MLQQVEHWPDPLTGEKLERRLLGSCSSGMLVTRPARKSSGIDLYWAGADPAGQLDWQLQHTIENYRRPPPGELAAALPTRIKGLWWLCRLERGVYQVADKGGGGHELFALTRRWLRRPGSSRRW